MHSPMKPCLAQSMANLQTFGHCTCTSSRSLKFYSIILWLSKLCFGGDSFGSVVGIPMTCGAPASGKPS